MKSSNSKTKSTALATTGPRAVTVINDNPMFPGYSKEEVDLIKNSVAKGTTDMELAYFLHVCRELNLSPLRRQVHCVKRKSKDGNGNWVETITIQTGIDGFLAIADRTRCYAPSEKPTQFEYKRVGNTDKLFSATVWVKKLVKVDRSWHEYPATAIFSEFVPLYRKDGAMVMTGMWEKMPHNQIEKCARAKALRIGFPEELGNIYVDEEMARHDDLGSGDAGVNGSPKRSKNDRERGTLEPGKQANRGHGDEGYAQTGQVIDAGGATVQDEKKAAADLKIETMDTKVEKIEPKMRKLTPAQVKENYEARKQKKTEPHEPQPYYILNCSGEIAVFCWDKKMAKAALSMQGKNCVLQVARRVTEKKKEFISLEGIISINGTKFALNPESNEWAPQDSAPEERSQEQGSDDDASLFGADGA